MLKQVVLLSVWHWNLLPVVDKPMEPVAYSKCPVYLHISHIEATDHSDA